MVTNRKMLKKLQTFKTVNFSSFFFCTIELIFPGHHSVEIFPVYLDRDIFWSWNISCLPYAHIYSGHHWGEIFPVHLETKYYLSLTTILYILLASFIAGGLYDRLWEALTAGQGDSHAHCPAPWNLPSEPGNLATTLHTHPSKPRAWYTRGSYPWSFQKLSAFPKPELLKTVIDKTLSG